MVAVVGLPGDVGAVLGGFLCCEFATIGRDGTPLAWPAVALHLPDESRFVLTTAIGFPVKAANIGRDPRVSMLFSDATGSGLTDPPTVLVQGTATVAEGVHTWGGDLERHWRRVSALQPAGKNFAGSPPARWFMDWYYMRLVIDVRPRTILWWPADATGTAPHRASDVG